MREQLQGIHPILWPLQLVGAVTTFALFLAIVGLTWVVVALDEVIWST